MPINIIGLNFSDKRTNFIVDLLLKMKKQDLLNSHGNKKACYFHSVSKCQIFVPVKYKITKKVVLLLLHQS